MHFKGENHLVFCFLQNSLAEMNGLGEKILSLLFGAFDLYLWWFRLGSNDPYGVFEILFRVEI